MKFVYPNQYADEPVGIENKVLPVFDNEEILKLHEVINVLACDKDDREKANDVLMYVKGMLSECGCTCEKDSFCEYVEGIIKITYLFDFRKDRMIEDWNYVVYQMF